MMGRSVGAQQIEEPAIRAKYEDYLKVRRMLAREMLISSLRASQADVEELSTRKASPERALVDSVPDVIRRFRVYDNRLDRLRSQLPRDSALLHFVAYGKFLSGYSGPRERRYLCFVVSPGPEFVQRIELGKAALIDESIARTRAAMLRRQSDNDPIADLSAQLWAKIEGRLPDQTKHILVCPDGALAWVPWGALRPTSSSGIILEQYSISLLPHPEQLVAQVGD